MRTDVMINQLRREAEKHQNDKLHTFDTDISLMCTDVANRLEQLVKENAEIRAKAIDEFAERIESHIFIEKTEEYSNSVSFMREIRKIAEQLKEGAI